MFERLRDENGFTGGYTIVKDYIRERERRGRDMFVPLTHPPGHAQADLGEAVVVIGDVEQKAHFFVKDLPHSDACYVRAYPVSIADQNGAIARRDTGPWPGAGLRLGARGPRSLTRSKAHWPKASLRRLERLTGALLDRPTHHVNIVEMNGESYRLAHSSARKPSATS